MTGSRHNELIGDRETHQTSISRVGGGRGALLFTAMTGTALTLASFGALALQGDYSVGAGVEYSDNITLDSGNERNDLIWIGLVGLSVSEESSNINGAARALIEHRKYSENTFDDETLLTLRSALDWRISENRFHWRIEDYFEQQFLDRQAPETPDNRVGTNVLSTGPDFFLRLDSVNSAEMGLRYSDYYFEESEADSERKSGYLRWIHKLRRGGELSVNWGLQDVAFDENVAHTDFDRQDLFASYDKQQAHTTLGVDLGISRIDRQNNDTIDGFLGRLLWTQEFRAASLIQIDASVQYTDTGLDLLTAGQRGRELDIVGEQLSADIFHDQRVEVTYQLGTAANSLEVQAIVRDEDFETDQSLDRTSHGGRILGRRAIAPLVTGTAFADYRRTKYRDDGEVQKDSSLGLGLSYRLARQLTASLQYRFMLRSSNIDVSEYDENRLTFVVYYGSDPYSYR